MSSPQRNEDTIDSPMSSLSSTPALSQSLPVTMDESFDSHHRGRSSSSPTIDLIAGVGDHHGYHHTTSSTSILPPLMSIQEVETMGTPTSSPLMRPASGRFVGGMRKLLRIPSGQAGVATSSVQAEMPSMATMEQHNDDLESTDKNHRILHKVMKQIKRHPRPVTLSRLRSREHIRRKHTSHSRDRHRHHHHYSDDGYTSDPGLLGEDQDEEEDTESGDREGARAERISRLRTKLDKYKKMLHDEELRLQDVKNEYVLGMVESVNDKDQHRLKKSFISKQGKAKDEIETLKRKVVHYEEQLQYLQQGGELSLPRQLRYTHKVKDQFNKFKQFGGMKSGIKMFKKIRTAGNGHPSVDLEDEELEEDDINQADDMETESATFPSDRMDIKDDDSPCMYCINEYSAIMENVENQKHMIAELQQKYSVLATKLEQERDKSERLENELNTLTDLHQNGVIELRGQLAQMERITFSKSQDLEDSIENCQSRLHKLEVQISNSADLSERPVVPVGVVRKVGVPALSYLLNLISVCFKLSEHVGKKVVFAVMIAIFAIVIFYILYQKL